MLAICYLAFMGVFSSEVCKSAIVLYHIVRPRGLSLSLLCSLHFAVYLSSLCEIGRL